ncbi:hypothetical protein A3H03_02200 [Candidatus Kuenenbacteria bacterium RIFCSPLOWO2_12_FULL_42_13]|uniref:Heteropolysaccharide repeat unit export protein n=3 Tax=Candidatus Kueneniibacteriota TaxID=1752740 RepID=A0A0G0Z3G1_9BACT|nr:MAG: Heteropolysaccharide repeat unit export protein [Candidatus Kuenenbacteria bacterium GW2011_GWA2_42_15]OGG89495.1 MAG: hypothetical protein A3C68_00380 [Candidatus Kuenenbacteria bacterium RIFCSPHIGHO2_02_FULL_42_29]OGG90614.1 MAG: hypothetical protein A3H55_00435 [Candidatus Kuenenbacteria bacterium RIFCSPLOWO2_02_FULL_42_16]OGG92496.1 MAG: hypothetical protein A3H03_02200 [Candidatus Kuenenbacteria bacterium RIFCSPLOWO2_12_FULL_42_13]
MRLASKIALNTIVHTAGKFGASIVGLLIVAILTRHLGVSGYGQYITVFSYLFFFAVLSDLGLYVVVVNELKRSRFGEEVFLNNIFTLRASSATALMILASGLVWFFPYDITIKLGVVFASIAIWLNLLDQIMVAFFQNRADMKRVAIAEIVGKLVILVLTVAAVYNKMGLITILIITVVGGLVNCVINFNYLLKFVRVKLAFNQEVWKEIFKLSWPVAVTSVFSLIYFKVDTLFLSVLPVNEIYAATRSEAVGIYGAPYKILEVLIGWPAIFMGLVSPSLSKAWAENRAEDFKRLFKRALAGLLMVVLPMIVGAAVLAKPLIAFVAGQEFAQSAPILQILIWATGIIFLSHLTTYALIALNKQKEMIKYYILAAVLAVAGYLFFIPSYSYFAAAVITVLVEFFMLITTTVLLRRNMAIGVDLKLLGKAALATLVMGMVLWFFRDVNVVILAIVGAGVYLLMLYLLKGMDREVMREMVGREIKK